MKSVLRMPLVLLAVGAAQVVCASSFQLSPWKGGGFGMFSTTDSPRNRFIALTGRDSGGNVVRVTYEGELSRALNLPPKVVARARTMPLNLWLTTIASYALNASFAADSTAAAFGAGSRPQRYRTLLAALADGSPAVMVAAPSAQESPVRLEEATARVLTVRVAPASASVRLEVIATATVRRADATQPH